MTKQCSPVLGRRRTGEHMHSFVVPVDTLQIHIVPFYEVEWCLIWIKLLWYIMASFTCNYPFLSSVYTPSPSIHSCILRSFNSFPSTINSEVANNNIMSFWLFRCCSWKQFCTDHNFYQEYILYIPHTCIYDYLYIIYIAISSNNVLFHFHMKLTLSNWHYFWLTLLLTPHAAAEKSGIEYISRNDNQK